MLKILKRQAMPVLMMLVLGAFAVPSFAYIPPAHFILRNLAQKHADYPVIQVRSMLTALDSHGLPTSTRLRETTIFNPQTATERSWVANDAGKLLYFTERHDRHLPLPAAILFDGSTGRLIAALKAAGITSDATKEGEEALPSYAPKLSLRRWKQTVAWVIGALSQSGGWTPQVWIEKDEFLPLRIITPQYDLQLDGFRNFQEFSYPRLAVLFEKGNKNPILKAELLDVSFNSQQTPSTAGEKVEGLSEAGKMASPQVRELLESYYSFVR